MGRRGPKPKWVEDANREQIIGLILRSDGRYTAHENRNKTFGKDRDEAIRRFYAWHSQQNGQTVTVAETGPPSESVRIDWEHQSKNHAEPEARKYYSEALATNETIKFKTVQDAAFWATVGKLIRKNPKLVARKTGIAEISYLSDLKPPQPSMPLAKIGEQYVADKTNLKPQELTNSKSWWDEFVRITKAKRVADLDIAAFRKYREKIKADQMKPIKRNGKIGPKSNSYTRSRFGKIGSIINHAMAEMDLSPQDRQTLGLKTLLKKPSKPRSNPVDIERDEIEAILKVANDFDTAMILVALNCCFYPVDIVRLRWDMIDFKKGVLCFDRDKSEHLTDEGIVRVAVLWKRTVKALKKIKTDHSHVFTYDGKTLNKQRPQYRFKKLLKKAGITRKLTFANLRDSGQTRAAEAGVAMQSYRVLAGHRIGGVDDDYIRRNPNFVKAACEAIERYYFEGVK